LRRQVDTDELAAFELAALELAAQPYPLLRLLETCEAVLNEPRARQVPCVVKEFHRRLQIVEGVISQDDRRKFEPRPRAGEQIFITQGRRPLRPHIGTG